MNKTQVRELVNEIRQNAAVVRNIVDSVGNDKRPLDQRLSEVQKADLEEALNVIDGDSELLRRRLVGGDPW